MSHPVVSDSIRNSESNTAISVTTRRTSCGNEGEVHRTVLQSVYLSGKGILSLTSSKRRETRPAGGNEVTMYRVYLTEKRHYVNLIPSQLGSRWIFRSRDPAISFPGNSARAKLRSSRRTRSRRQSAVRQIAITHRVKSELSLVTQRRSDRNCS